MVNIVLVEPDIPQNTGTIARFAACFDVKLHLIEPLGFVLSDKKFRRSGMDYLDFASVERHANLDDYISKYPSRLILFTTKAVMNYHHFSFEKNDSLLYGSESRGVADEVHQKVDYRLLIPMKNDARSINLAMSVAMSCGEALRQIDLI